MSEVTKEELEAMKARAEAATRGEWSCKKWRVVALTGDALRWDAQRVESANAEFIAHAHQDLPRLIAEIERQRLAMKTADAGAK